MNAWPDVHELERKGDAGTLIQMLSDENWLIRSDAAESLGMVGNHNSAGPLEAVLSDSIGFVRAQAAAALGRLGSSQAVQPLISALNDKEPFVRAHAAQSLGKIGDRSATQALISALEDGSDLVRGRAVQSLGELGDAQAVAPLIALLDDPEMSIHAVHALGKIGPAAIQPVLDATVGRGDLVEPAANALRLIGQAAIAPLILALDQSPSHTRITAAKALGDQGDSEVAMALMNSAALYHEAWAAAISSLNSRGRQSVDVAGSLLRDPQTAKHVKLCAIQVLQGMTGDEVVEVLIHALNSKDAEVRMAAASALGTIGDYRAVAPLTETCRDEDVKVAESASIALGKINAPVARLSPEMSAGFHMNMRIQNPSLLENVPFPSVAGSK